MNQARHVFYRPKCYSKLLTKDSERVRDSISPELILDVTGVLSGVVPRHASYLQRALRQHADAI